MRLAIVVLPHPDSPTKATFFPGSNNKLILLRTFFLLESEG